MYGDSRNLTSNELRAAKTVYAFIKDGELYKNRWTIGESKNGLVEVVDGMLYINSKDNEYIERMKKAYNKYEYNEVKIGLAPTEALSMHYIIESLEFEKAKEKEIIEQVINYTEVNVVIDKYLKFEGYSINVKIIDSAIDRLKMTVDRLKDVKVNIEVLKVFKG